MSPLKTKVAFPLISHMYMKLWGTDKGSPAKSRFADNASLQDSPVCKGAATANDALPTTVSPHPPAEIWQGVTRCFSHSEMWCYCCCSKSGGAY